ncbi:hypothetical protein PR202_ga16734 [Eleusine coracana subsp. coracana]|uniref:Core Histone H2A/H2B/H3 domain-containing protein n=1 Tax=Eleusine coracana subsp. coracana TaxID=191504 RepID=A0AAV5CND7_ELECO|nr:hypothetical protein PR202_ga16734 [Eleusine coracana subsp. coracana]
MAPKRRNRVVGSVVKTKVVQETVEVTTAIVADDLQQAAVQELPAGVNVSGGSTVVRVVEVTTPDGGDTGAADVNVTKKQSKKRGRVGSNKAAAAAAKEADQGKKTPPPQAPAAEEEEEETPVSLQSQETQDPNEHEAGAEEDDDASKKKKRRQHQQRGGMGGMGGYKRYVWRVLKQVHPELGVSGRAMQVLDMMMADMFERLAAEAARLSKITGRMTLTSREVQTAVRLVLPGELGKHAISESVKAISKYTASTQ